MESKEQVEQDMRRLLADVRAGNKRLEQVIERAQRINKEACQLVEKMEREREQSIRELEDILGRLHRK